MAKASFFLTLALLLTIASTGQANSQEEHRGYLLQSGDMLQISVWNEPDLKKDILIRPDGSFSFPLVGEIKAQAHTVSEVTEELTIKLRKFIPDADVTISAMQLQGNRIYVIGNVNRPGEFPVSSYVDVMQALSIAGGTNKFADLSDILVLRRVDSEQKSIPFNYSQVERGVKLEQNIVLNSGDIVVVP